MWIFLWKRITIFPSAPRLDNADPVFPLLRNILAAACFLKIACIFKILAKVMFLLLRYNDENSSNISRAICSFNYIWNNIVNFYLNRKIWSNSSDVNIVLVKVYENLLVLHLPYERTFGYQVHIFILIQYLHWAVILRK